MKNYILFVALFACSILRGQTVFRHITATNNTSGHITTLDHPQLNGNPNAIIFIMPNWNTGGGTSTAGVSYNPNAGVYYTGSRWAIFNENIRDTMPLGVTFNVLLAPPNHPNYFITTATRENITANGPPNGFQINHPATNGKTDAFLLVTQNWLNVYNNNAPIVHYHNGTWRISNNGYENVTFSMPVGARFNVMVIDNNIVAGFSNAVAFKHIANEQNTIPADSHITFLNQTSVNGNQNAILFATPYWGHSDTDRGNDPTKAGGPYSKSSSMVWYDHPNDSWHHKDNYWSILHKGVDAMPKGAKFHVVAVNVNAPNCTPLANVTYESITLSTIQTRISCLTTNRVNGSNNANNLLRTGTIILYRTNEGRLGKTEILNYDYNIRLRCTTYNNDGSIYRQNNNLTIRGTWSCDFDNAIESSTGQDFFWQQATEIERWLTPQNGATFWVAKAGSGIPTPSNELTGFVDMHTHPMSHLGFGGKLIHGAPDVGILVPAIPSGDGCRHYERAANIDEALSTCRSTHGGHGVRVLGIGEGNTCGDDLRKAILRGTESNLHARTGHHEEGARGFPAFAGWPAHNDITHQQMWIDWVKRTYQNGLRVMVALTVNNATLAAAMSGPGDRNPDDVSSSNIQIDEMKRMVARHNGSAGSVDNWMEIAYSAADIRRIVSSNRLAVILGMEVDNIGNFNKNNAVDANNLNAITTQTVRNEIQRVYNQGVRYIFPVHLVDNKFGGTAIYEDMFNLSNYHQTGRHWDIGCAAPSDGITKKFVVAGFDAPLAVAKAKIGVDIFRNPPTPPDCGAVGHVNNLGLTPLGEFAIKEMMRLGMILDIDHMSKKCMDRTFQIAQDVASGGYPLNAGHNGIRGNTGSERSLNVAQAQAIMSLGGLIGVGCSKSRADQFTQNFTSILNTLGVANARLAIGTDINGFEQGPSARAGSAVSYNASFPMCQTGGRSWDYNREGVAHYGLLPDFLKDVNSLSSLRIFDNHLMKSAEYFAQMWEKCERQRGNVR